MTYAIAIVNKNLVNRTVPFDNQLVPLNGHIAFGRVLELWLFYPMMRIRRLGPTRECCNLGENAC